jgi:3-isopropylmalate/(R)-2-methylmalate dehydratase small subunit
MTPFTTLTGVAAPLDIMNVDTDMIIPKQYLKTIKRTGLGTGLFSEMRYKDDGSDNADFVLNKPAYRKAEILVAGDNFGCGSSREHAPWALLEGGFRVVIAPSYGDIFFNNSFKSGLLPIVLAEAEVDRLLHDIQAFPGFRLTIDLEKQLVIWPDQSKSLPFEVDAFRKYCLMNGLDDIGLTMRHADKIRDFEQARRLSQPWLFPLELN